MAASTTFQNFSSNARVFSGRSISDMSTPSALDQKQQANSQYLRVSFLALATILAKAGRLKSSAACFSRRRTTKKRGVSRMSSGVGEGGSSLGDGSFAR